jgi:hypothetical protein
MDDEFDPTAEGLMQCLQVLAEEASWLSLNRTFAAVHEALSVCREESASVPVPNAPVRTNRYLH